MYSKRHTISPSCIQNVNAPKYISALCVASPVITVKPGPGCPVCGTMSTSGTRSCCAPGGAWFQKCGYADDPDFEHTWTEGIQACKQVTSLLLDKAQSQLVARTTRQPSSPRRDIVNYADHFVYDAGTNLGGYHELSKLSISICLLFAVLHIQRE